MAAQDRSIVDLLKAAISDAQELIRSEAALVKAEVRQEVSRIRVGIVAFAGAAVAAIVAVVLLAATLAWGISEGFGWPVWGGFAIVTPADDCRRSCPGCYRASAFLGATCHAADGRHTQGEREMDSSPDVLADEVRVKQHPVDNDLELLRVRLQKARPTSQDALFWAQRVLPVVAGATGVWWWSRRRRSVDSLDALLVHALDELYQGEQQLVPALHRMAAQASDPELKKAFKTHSLETAIHVDRLQRVFQAVGAKLCRRRGKTAGLGGLIADADHLLKRKVNPDVRDAWLIATAQRIEHVEISAYGTARTYAEMLGFDHAARLLQETLEEERTTDEKLTRLARGFVNPQSVRSPRRSRREAVEHNPSGLRDGVLAYYVLLLGRERPID